MSISRIVLEASIDNSDNKAGETLSRLEIEAQVFVGDDADALSLSIINIATTALH